ncbi:MAG: sugar ABC transporter ATP-binding protein [Candidatus Promineifilaceae bacterium]|nr:sugar ABC transporter ATP-binding protein [Candidatus Promineifilaceae bacterium]
MGQSKILEVKGCNKSFPGVKALADFNFDLYEGEIHCVVGENGAGKSTFIKILSGALRPDEGTIFLNGDEYSFLTPSLAQERGVRTIYQEIALAPSMTVAENIFMGKEPKNRFGMVDYPSLNRQSEILLENLQIDVDVRALVGSLNVAEKQSVQIAKAMTDEAKIFILDEPTASFSSSEISNLLELVRGVAARGVGVIYISHHLDEVFNIHDRITILRDGRKVNTHGQNEVTEETIISEMVGRDMSKFYSREQVEIDTSRTIEFNNISGGPVKDISFSMHKGEIVGFAGMVGSGRTDLVKSIFGAIPNSSGTIIVEGQEIPVRNPSQAIKGGLSLLTEDRQKTGLVLDHAVKWNVSLVELVNSKGRLIHEKNEIENANKYVDALDIKTPSINRPARNLSGGNQQKVVLAKWLYSDAQVIIFDEPTRGIDIGAKEEIYKLMVELAREGRYIIMVSSDMPELIAMCDRVFVMRNGEISAELDRDHISEETILTYSIGGVL